MLTTLYEAPRVRAYTHIQEREREIARVQDAACIRAFWILFLLTRARQKCRRASCDRFLY